MPDARRALILGLDALVPNTMERFLAEGVLPNLAALAERGSFSRIRPCIPAQTPTNWTTIATGATPGTHGVVQWGSHIPGEPIREFHRAEAFNAGLCRAEYLWEAAARAGKRSVVMNYAGYPPTTDAAVHIDWLFQPARSYFDLAPATVYHNCPDLDTTDPIALRPGENGALVADIPVAPAEAGEGPSYVAAADGDTLRLYAPDDEEPVAVLLVGEWSEWLRAPFQMAEGEVEGAFRFKLLEIGNGRLRLYRSDAFPTDGRFCSSPELGARLVDALGPYVHGGRSCELHCHGSLDWATVDEVLADEAVWWSSAAEAAMAETHASLLVLHWHILDAMGHRFVQCIDETGSQYDPAQAERYWDIVRNYYRAADRFVGAFLERFDDGATAFAVVADHGMPANTRAVSLVNAFQGRGWLAFTEDGQDVDWARSSVFFAQNHLWINLAGRDEGGIVPPEEHAALRADVIAVLRDIKDPETGEHVIAFALTREDAPMVGLWGDYLGDIVYCYAGGIRWSGPEVLRMGEERVVFPCGGGNHGPMVCTYETDATSVMGTLVLAGAGLGRTEPAPRLDQFRIATTDVAPTIAHLLGIDRPAQSEGRVLHEFLAAGAPARPERTLVATDRPLVARPSAKPRPIQLQGDVTDET
ncbi:alkaline phosphatase family protein [bacterium]|nr:alkaline phosphatase family protein [bacterium]